MTTTIFVSPNISCHHCANAIKMELGDIAGVNSVEVDVPTKKVTVVYVPPADEKQLVDMLNEINYPPESVT